MDIVHWVVTAFSFILSLHFAESMRRREPLRRHYLTLLLLVGSIAFLLLTTY
jgi:hypothetical protein